MTSASGASACALMFSAVAYLAVRQRRLERNAARAFQNFAEDMREAQVAWTIDTVRQIEKAMRGPR